MTMPSIAIVASLFILVLHDDDRQPMLEETMVQHVDPYRNALVDRLRISRLCGLFVIGWCWWTTTIPPVSCFVGDSSSLSLPTTTATTTTTSPPLALSSWSRRYRRSSCRIRKGLPEEPIECPCCRHGSSRYRSAVAMRSRSPLSSSPAPASASDDSSSPLNDVDVVEDPLHFTAAPADATAADAPMPIEKVPSYPALLRYLSTVSLLWLSEPLLSLVDTTCVSWAASGAAPRARGAASPSALLQLAAMGPATTYMDTVLYLTYFLAICTTSQVAELRASKRYRDLQLSTSRLLGVAAACGIAVAALTWALGPRILRLLVGGGGGGGGAAESLALVELASAYSRVRAAAAPLSVLGMVAQALCLVTGRARAVAASVAVASLINVAGDLALAPRFGMLGAAAATALASSAGALWLLRRVFVQMLEWRELEKEERAKLMPFDPSWEDERAVPLVSLPDRRSLGELAALSAPLCFRMWAIMASHAMLTVRVARLGAAAAGAAPALAAHSVLVRAFYFLSAPGDGIGSAAQTFVPAALYPSPDAEALRGAVARLGVVAGAVAAAAASAGLLALGGPSVASWLALDPRTAALLRSAAVPAAAALLLHPAVALVEGVAIARRDFGCVVRTYAVTVAAFVPLLATTAGSLAGVWRALVCWQGLRLVNYLAWSKARAARPPIP